MTRGIYLIQKDQSLVEMREQAYDSETLLQELLAEYPNILAGEQAEGNTPRRWLLVSREMSLPFEEQGAGRWSVDHLFVDQDAIPTLVEVKRSSDSRIRREVVGQMLDYAANGIVYWPIEKIRASLAATCQRRGLDLDAVLTEFLGAETEAEQFWQKVKANLGTGNIRLVFVADEIPAELRRIVEFLNGQMDPAEVLAIEVRQFVGQGLKALVPVVIGQTAGAQLRKGKESRQWDEASFVGALEERRDAEGLQSARAILQWVGRCGLRLWWGRGPTQGSLIPVLDHGDDWYAPIAMYTSQRKSYLQVQFFQLKSRPPFDDPRKREELRDRLNAIPGVAIAADAIERYPRVETGVLCNDTTGKQFFEVLDWVLEEIRRS